MKFNCMRAIAIIMLMAFSFGVTGQEIKLHSGKFIPPANSSTISRSSEIFMLTRFQENNYVVIQFEQLPSEAEKMNLKSVGIRLIDYIPDNAFTASISDEFELAVLPNYHVRSVFQFLPVHKSVPALLKGDYPPHAVKVPGFVDLTIITYERFNASVVNPSLQTLGASILEEYPMFRNFVVRVSISNAKKIAELPFVQWVEFIDPPNQKENLLGRSLHRVNVLNDGVRNLKGDGVKIGEWDENEVSPHLDFSPYGRVIIMEPTGNTSSHSTHVAGTITGRGLIDPRARGMAPNAYLFSYNFSGNIAAEMSAAIPGENLSISSHSYGGSVSTCSLSGSQIAYSSTSRNTDLNLNSFPYHIHVHSAGNSQGSCAGGWYTITGSGKTAKNNILVANITTAEALSGSSSCGPTNDGRIKPEISSFGSGVLSTYTPLNTYASISGTSMATPGVSGTTALLVQRYRQLNGGVDPPSSLIKNVLCNTATDLGNPGPDYRFGFGRVNALGAVRILEENRYAVNSISNGSNTDFSISVPAGASKLRVMLTWNDPAGAANANPALVNNLDLAVMEGVTTTLPWILDKDNPGNIATRGVDNVGNIEQVTIDNPTAGSYTLRVSGTSIPAGPQQFSITWSIDMPHIEVTYPNGGESLNPGTNETITWNNAGVTSNQTIEYSVDNGANWTTIANNIPPNTTRLVWAVPSANTSQALIRITHGALSDVSDLNFRILGTPTNFTTNAASCNSGELAFTWSAVNNATHYTIYKLDASTGQWVILAADITGTTYTATGLVPNESMWFTIVAKNNSTGAISERAYAINRTVSAGGVAPIGSITGPAAICGTPSGVSYTVAPVAGATTYTWTVPAGAVIASGQGTPSISVNFPSGANSGNVTVFASAGICQTTTSVQGVTVSGTAVAAPASGGNQSVMHCDPNPVPTLTATANVPPGYSVVWYDAPTGGSIVPSPTLNVVGTITYYAGAVENASSCESNSRTAVTLTITTAPNATISASGTTTFCNGGNVVLTASAGSSYTWSNGATTQSITVNTSGAYSVTITQVGGCTSTSSSTNVTVNPVPVSTISANGPLSFCEGENVVLSATPGSSYSWNNGATTPSITVTSSGNYTVTVTNAEGCSAISAATIVTVAPSPTVNISATPYTRLFPGLSTSLNANVSPAGTYTYVWLKDGVVIPGAGTATIPVNIDGLGNYSVTVSNNAGCTNTSAIQFISDSASARLFIYPNPNTGLFQVSYHNPSQSSIEYTLTIFDSKGAYVYRQSYQVNTPYQRMQVDMTKFAGGVYQLVLSDRSGKRLASGGVVIQ